MKSMTNKQVADAMFEMIERCGRSGISQRRFCEENNIAVSSFYYWKKKYIESRQVHGFIPVKLTSGRVNAANIEIQYPNGVVLRLPGDISINYLRSLMAIL